MFIHSKELLAPKKPIPKSRFREGFNINDEIRIVTEGKQQVAEFIGTSDFNQNFISRQQYEVDAGRKEEPLLYTGLYDITEDSTLPRNVPVNVLGPAGVIFDEIKEGGEVKFATVGESSKTIPIVHHGVGLEYTEDLFIYNELWRLSRMERQFGRAHNAKLNHIHLYPIISYSYGAANQTDGSSLTNFRVEAKLPEKYMRAVEAAIAHSVTDTSNPRTGPYAIMCSTADVFTFQRALSNVPQQGYDEQSDARGRIRGLIAYDGWTGTRGKKSVTYTGVSAGTAYLIHLGNMMEDYQSYVKHGLRRQSGNADMSRFVLDQVIWDFRQGVYANPLRSVEKITLPSGTDGAST